MVSFDIFVGSVPNQTAEFGDLTAAGEGGFKPYDSTNTTTVDLTSYDSLVSGSLGIYTPQIVNGALEFTGGNGAPNGAVLRCSHADGTVDITISELTDAYHVADKTEFQRVLDIAASTKSGKTCYLRGGTYVMTGNGNTVNKFKDMANYFTIRSANINDLAILENSVSQGGAIYIGNSPADASTPGKVIIEYLQFNLVCTPGDKKTTDFNSDNHSGVYFGSGDTPTDCIIRHCKFVGNAPIARSTGNRPDATLQGIRMLDGDTIVIEDCYGEYINVLSNLTGTGLTVQRCEGRYLWDDPIKITCTTATPATSNVTVKDCVWWDFIGDHGFHPDWQHMFVSGSGTGINNVTIQGQVFFPGTEGCLGPAWPTLSPAATRETTLTTSNRTLDDADDGQFIFVDGSQNVDITLDLTSITGDIDCIVQVWTPTGAAPTGTVRIVTTDTIDSASIGKTGSAPTSPLTFVEPWETYIIYGRPGSSNWRIDASGAAYQGVQTNAPTTNGIDNVDVSFNVVWVNANSLNADRDVSTDWDVYNNSFIPVYPGDLSGTGVLNTRGQYGPDFGSGRFIQFDSTTNVVAKLNIASSITEDADGTPTTPSGAATDNVLAAELDLNGTWSDFHGAFTVANTGTQEHMPTVAKDGVVKARPKAGGTLDGLGMGALGTVVGDDYYNFWIGNGGDITTDGFTTQGTGTPGFLSTAPWYVGRLVVSPAVNGFSAAWVAPYAGQGAITGYDVERNVNSGGWVDNGHTGTGTTDSYSGGSTSDSIQVRVRAVNANGAGPWVTADAVVAT